MLGGMALRIALALGVQGGAGGGGTRSHITFRSLDSRVGCNENKSEINNLNVDNNSQYLTENGPPSRIGNT